jgi:hypothetical protein
MALQPWINSEVDASLTDLLRRLAWHDAGFLLQAAVRTPHSQYTSSVALFRGRTALR